MHAANRPSRVRRAGGRPAVIPPAAVRVRPVAADRRRAAEPADEGRWPVRRAALAILGASLALWGSIALLARWVLAEAGPFP